MQFCVNRWTLRLFSDTVAVRTSGYNDAIAIVSQPLRKGHNFRVGNVSTLCSTAALPFCCTFTRDACWGHFLFIYLIPSAFCLVLHCMLRTVQMFFLQVVSFFNIHFCLFSLSSFFFLRQQNCSAKFIILRSSLLKVTADLRMLFCEQNKAPLLFLV